MNSHARLIKQSPCCIFYIAGITRSDSSDHYILLSVFHLGIIPDAKRLFWAAGISRINVAKSWIANVWYILNIYCRIKNRILKQRSEHRSRSVGDKNPIKNILARFVTSHWTIRLQDCSRIRYVQFLRFLLTWLTWLICTSGRFEKHEPVLNEGRFLVSIFRFFLSLAGQFHRIRDNFFFLQFHRAV